MLVPKAPKPANQQRGGGLPETGNVDSTPAPTSILDVINQATGSLSLASRVTTLKEMAMPFTAQELDNISAMTLDYHIRASTSRASKTSHC